MNYSKLNQMSIDELMENMIVDIIKGKKAIAGYEMKQQLYIGAINRLNGKQCRVEKINRTICNQSVRTDMVHTMFHFQWLN